MPTSLSYDDLLILRERVQGAVTTRGDRDYDEQRTPWLDVVEQLPAAIVNAETVQDVVETIRFAHERGLLLGVQNTGHGVARPCNGGVLLRLSAMEGVTVDAAGRTATVEPGVTFTRLLDETEAAGLVFPAGQVSSVGVTGYTLGGGVGWIARTVGPACHAVKEATIVLADGSVVTASATENADLFWALRGGGGNFGVVTSLALDLFPLPQVFGGMAYYRIEDAPDVLCFYRKWSAGLTNATSSVVRLERLPPSPRTLLHLHGLQTCSIGLCHTDLTTAEALHQQILDFKTPAIDDLALRPYSEMDQFDGASGKDGATSYSALRVLRGLDDAVMEGLVETARQYMPPLAVIEVQQLGGALSDDPESAAYTAPAAPADGAPAGPYAIHIVSPAMSESLEALARDTERAFDVLGDVFTGETSYNYLRGDQQDRVPDAFGAAKYGRLRTIKERYDPSNLFSINMNIPPASESGSHDLGRSSRSMKLLVVGAAGKTGRAVVEQALAAGHEVTAFVHHAGGFDVPGARVVEGDATDRAAVEAAVAGQDAVLDTIGGKTPYKETTLESSAASTIIAAMRHAGVRRLVVTSVLGEGESTENAPFYERLLVRTYLRGADTDKAAMESAVEDSGLDWVILRPAILTDDPATGSVRVFDAETGEKAHTVTRADLAAFMIEQASSDEHLHQDVTIANR